MRFLAGWSLGIALGVLVAGSACAQYVISSHSGVIQYVEGRAFLSDKPVEPKFGQFPDIKENQEFRTEDGRAEVLLTPGVFLRMGENSAIRMLDNRLISTRVEVLSGSVIVESEDPQMSIKNSPVTMIYKDYEIHLLKHGLVEISSDPAQMKVYNGEAQVLAG